MPLGIYFKRGLRTILVDQVAAALGVQAATGETSREQIGAVLALGRGMAESLGMSWSRVLADAQATLGTDAGRPRGAATASSFFNGRDSEVGTVHLQIMNTGKDPLEVTEFQLSGSEAYGLTWRQDEWAGSGENKDGADVRSSVQIEGGRSREMQVHLPPPHHWSIRLELRLKAKPLSGGSFG